VACQVLLIDDEPDLLSILSFYLEDAGYQVLTAPDGSAAIELLQQHLPDAIVCDLHLPGMSGIEICRTLRQNPQWQALCFILLSGTASQSDFCPEAGLGIDEYLTKPFDPENLLAVLARNFSA
jgi:CheY-like chemotaxis protein